MRRVLLLSLALTALAAWPISAGAHEKASAYSSAFGSYFGEGQPVGMLGMSALDDPQPLEGTGKNMRIIANLPLKGTVAGSDIELAGDYAYVGSYGEGMVIIDISDPFNPKRAGVFKCAGGSQFDVQLQPGSNPKYAVLAVESQSGTKECHKNDEGFALIDISDKANPTEVAFVGQAPNEGNLTEGAHNTTMDWPYLYVDQYLPHGTRGAVDIFDLRKLIADPLDRKPIGIVPTTEGGAHDLQVDHRPDGKVIAYAASIGFTDTFDVTDPTKPKILQRLDAPSHGVGISHGIEPNFDRTLAIESDEFGGGSGLPGCGGGEERIPPPLGAASVAEPGALHFLRLTKEGLIKGAGTTGAAVRGQPVDQGSVFNIPAQPNASDEQGCTAHVFWQAPDENRLTVAWYGRGTRIVDFSNPADPKELGHFIPKGAETWSAKPHKGYIFTGDTVRGMDVLEYTGEDCSKWPTTSGAAEVQRDRYQGATAPAATDAPKSTPSRGPATPASADTPPTCSGSKPKQQTGGQQQCRDNDPAPTLPDGPGTGGTGGSACPGGTNQQNQQNQNQQGGQQGQPTACTSNAGFSRATARSAGRSGGVTFDFARRVSQPATVDVFQQSVGRKVTGERLVKRFTNKTGPFTWNGRDKRGRKVPTGFYFARFRVAAPNGQADTVRVTLGRSQGRFSPRRAFYRRDSCGTLKTFKLSRPVFGGKRSSSLGIAYRLNQPGRVQVTVTNARERTIRRYAASDVAAGVTKRLTLSPKGLARGDYRVKLSVTRNGQTTTSTLTANRL